MDGGSYLAVTRQLEESSPERTNKITDERHSRASEFESEDTAAHSVHCLVTH
jgi:hypothetical protein